MDSKIKTRITKSAIILFMLAVDRPLRFVLFSTGSMASFFGIFTLLANLALMIAERKVFIDLSSFMFLLSMSITGIAALRVALRAQPYRYNSPYLDREIINKRTTVIPLSVLGIAGIFYMGSTLYGHDYLVVTSLLYMKLIGIVGFLYAILETIILRRVALAPGNANEALASDAATLASDAAASGTGTYAHVTKLQGDGSTWWGSWLILIMGVNASVLWASALLAILYLHADLLARDGPMIITPGVVIFFLLNIIYIWGLVLFHFARRYWFKSSIKQLPEGAGRRAVMNVAVVCDIVPFITLTLILSDHMHYIDRLPPLIF